MRLIRVVACLLIGASPSVWAQQAPAGAGSNPQSCCEEMQQQFKDLQERIIALEGQVRTLKDALAAQSAVPAAPMGATAPMDPAAPQAVPGANVSTQAAESAISGADGAAQLPNYGGASALAKALNPDIGMIGNFVGSVGANSQPPLSSQTQFPSLEMHESELGIQAIVDPYARADFFLSFGEEGVGLEEGYITFTSLPQNFVVKAGKMRAAFGKVNTMHNHVLSWVDRPLVTDNLVGGEEGIDDAGISVTRILPAPKGLFLEATGQLFRGDSGDLRHPLFVASQKSDVSTVAHLRAYKDITESTNLDLGLSFAQGHNGGSNLALLAEGQDFVNGNFLTRLYGADATFRWKPLRRAIYHSFIGRTELVWSQRQQVSDLITGGGPLPSPLPRSVVRSFGYYVSGDYQLGRRWFAGGRFDWSERARQARADHGASALLTFRPSEFSQVRGQYRFTHYAEGNHANELLLQLLFVLGAHGAHPF